MGLFSFGSGGGGSSSGQQAQQNYQYNQNLQQAMSYIWGPQAQALQGLYGGAGQLMGQQANRMYPAAQQALGTVMPQAQTAYNQMGQFANPNSYLARRQLADYSQQVGQNFSREILPQLRTNAGQVMGMGSSRDALARGVAAGDAARAIAQGSTDIYSNQYNMAAQAAQQMPGMAAQLYNMRMAPYQAQWAPYTSAAGIYGGPTSLQASQTQGFGETWGAGANTQQSKQNKTTSFSLF